MPIEERFSEDQPRDPDGKFGSGSSSSPHENEAVKKAGGFVPHAPESAPVTSLAGHVAADHEVLAEHMNEFLKEGNVDSYHAFSVADKALSGGKVSKGQARIAHDVLVEHHNEAQKEGNKALENTLKAALDKLSGMRSLSQIPETTEKYMSIERRYATELRAGDTQGIEMVLTGYAARFNTPSKDLGGFRETISSGAFTRALAEKQDVVCLFNHGMKSDVVLGRTTAGTLVVTADEKGLFFRCQLDPNQQSHRDLHASVKRGDINECSFAFTPNGPNGDDWTDAKDERGNWYISRTLKDVNLFDVSAVTRPAYSNTSLQARSENVTPEIRSIITNLLEKRGVKAPVEKRDESVEQTMQCISKCLAQKFPQPTTGGECCSNYGMYYIVATYDDSVIACNNYGPGPNEYVRIPYVAAPDLDNDNDVDEYIFGTPVPVEQEWVPSERAVAKFEESRTIKAEHLAAIAAGHTATAKEAAAAAEQHTNTADGHSAAAAAVQAAADAAKEKEEAAKRCMDSMGDCSEKRCICQNRMVNPEDVYYGDDENEWDYNDTEDERALKTARRVEIRKEAVRAMPQIGEVRTKLVGGKHVALRAFAHAGDPEKTETWKLPTHTADHATQSLNRVDAVKLPADKAIEARTKLVASVAKYAPAPIVPGEDRSIKYLVTESDGTTHLPVSTESGTPDHGLMGNAWAALHGGFRGNEYAGPNKSEAISKLKAMYKSEGMDEPDSRMSKEEIEEMELRFRAAVAI